MVRRGADPGQIKSGPINAIVPNPPTVPSHHGPDVQTVMYGLDITTMALLVPTTIMHQHNLMVELEKDVSVDDVIDKLENTSRVLLLEAEKGMDSTASVMEFARDLGRPRGDLFEIAVWKESLNIVDQELFYMQAIHQESDVVPENVDAIRAILELESDPAKSIAKPMRTWVFLVKRDYFIPFFNNFLVSRNSSFLPRASCYSMKGVTNITMLAC